MQVDVQAKKSAVTVARARRRGSLRSPHRRALRLGLLFVSPWIAGFLLFFAYPFFATIYYGFTDFNGVGAAHWIGFTNYVNLFHDPLFKTSLFNTFYYTAIELPLSTVAALGLALLLNMNVRGRAV
ncbi:MAG: carbohydrate ABC transporter permease, partial [Acidimicrobiales bacterium]